jgi:hypothetical protein
MNVDDQINILTNDNEIFLKLLLLMKTSLPHSDYLLVIILLIKFLGVFIISNFFLVADNIYSLNFVQMLKKLTCFGIFSKTSFLTYSVLGYFFIFLIAIYLTLVLWTYKLLRADHRTNFKKANYMVKIISCFNIVFLTLSQHFIEYFSFVYYIHFNGVDNKIHTLFTNTNSDYLLLTLSTFGIVFMNIFLLFSIHMLNEPTNITKSLFKFHINFFCIITTIIYINFQALHFTDDILGDTYVYKLAIAKYTILITLLMSQFFKRINQFSFRNFAFYAIQCTYCYIFISCVIEIIIYLTNCPITSKEHVIALSTIKIVYSVVFCILSDYIYKASFIKQCKNILLKEFYNDKFTYIELQSFYFFQDLVISGENANSQLFNILKISFNHKTDCTSSICICKKISADFSNISIVLENIYNRLNFLKNPHINRLYFEYLLKLKKSHLFAYGLIKTFICKNDNRMSIFDKMLNYTLLIETVKVYRDECTNHVSEASLYINIRNRISLYKDFESQFRKIIEIYEYFLDFKEKFDNCIKIDSSGVNSFIFNDINKLIDNCRGLKSQYRGFKQTIKDNFSLSKCLDFELSFKIHLFFRLFNKKIPQSLNKLLLHETEDVYKLIEEKYTSNNHYNIIFSINKLFEVKYFSYRLAEILGYPHSFLIGNDLHNIFPRDLRENHKRVILKHILLDNDFKFHRRTIAFTSYNTNISISIKACAFTNFNNELEFICDIELLDEEPKLYYFVLDSAFNMMSFNRTFENTYYLNFELLQRLNLDILKLMDISQNTVKNRFKDTLLAIYSRKDLKNFFYIFSGLFNLNLPMHDIDRNYKDYFINSSLIRDPDNSKTTDNNLTILGDNSRADLSKTTRSLLTHKKTMRQPMISSNVTVFTVEKEKIIMLHNLEKVASKQKELDLKDEDLKNIEAGIQVLRRNAKNKVIFKINIYLKNYIDTCFYIVKINEETRFDPDTPLPSRAVSFNPVLSIIKPFEKKKYDNKLESKLLSKCDISVDVRSKPPTMLQKVGSDTSCTTQKDGKTFSIKVFNYHLGRNLLGKVKGNINHSFRDKIHIVLIILLAIILGLHSYLFQYKSLFLDNLTNNFQSQYYIEYQISAMIFLQSTIISWMFKVGNLTVTSQAIITYRQNQMRNWTQTYRNTFFRFIEEIHKLDDTMIFESLYKKNNTFHKIDINWYDIEYTASLFEELNYIQYATYYLSGLSDWKNLNTSLNEMFLFEQYNDNPTSPITKEDKIVYYVNKNFPSIYNTLSKIEHYIYQSSQQKFEDNNLKILVIESIIIVVFLSLVIIVRYMLNSYDEKFFKMILSMFLDMKKPKESSYKTPLEISILKTNIKIFKCIMENINYEPSEDINDLMVIANQNKRDFTMKTDERLRSPINTTEHKLMTTFNNYTTHNNDKTASGVPFANDMSRSFNRSQNGLELRRKHGDEDLQVITNSNILNETKHYQLTLIKVSKILLTCAFLVFLILTITNIMISTTNFEFFKEVQTISESFIGEFALVAQLFNYVRWAVFTNDKKMADNVDYNELLNKIASSNKNYTIFINDFSEYLPSASQLLGSMSSVQDLNRPYLCFTAKTCELNKNGLQTGQSSALRFITLIYDDFVKMDMGSISDVDDIKGFFYSDQFTTVTSELQDVLGMININIFELVIQDFSSIADKHRIMLTILGLVNLFYNAFVILYLLYFFLTRTRLYMNSLIYSANKFNSCLYKE